MNKVLLDYNMECEIDSYESILGEWIDRQTDR